MAKLAEIRQANPHASKKCYSLAAKENGRSFDSLKSAAVKSRESVAFEQE